MKQKMLTEITDTTGLDTLEIFADTDKFNFWLFETLAPFCKNNLLEIGSGIGNISEFLLGHFSTVSLSDLRNEYCEILRQKFGSHEHLQSINLIDLSEKEFEKKYRSLKDSFDTIIASNVVEHIEDDHLAVRNCKWMLRKGGSLVVLVPAYQWLYNDFDKELGHFRRYNKNKLAALFADEGFEIVHSQYFNFAGIFGWWFSGTVLKKKVLPKNQLVLYNKLIPLIRLADKLVMRQSGLSVIVAGEKK
jgi:2-polyprenyl-3-methyl-5-hydroxy-6-metoxy-1,4-benzoquinol methylase